MENLGDEHIRDMVSRMTVDQIRRFIQELDLIDLREVSTVIGSEYHRAKMLRKRSLEAGGPRPDGLPDPVPMPGKSPLYLRREVLDWAQRTGRVHADGTPRRLKSVGRTPEQRCDAQWLITV